MSDAERFTELTTWSRMAWSSRSVWDRRPPQRRDHSHQSDLGRAGRGGNRYRPDRLSHRGARLLATTESMVSENGLKGERNG